MRDTDLRHDELDIPMPRMAPAEPSYRVARRSAESMEPSMKRLLVFAGGVGAALLLLVGVYEISGHRHGGVPVVEADSRPLRTKPDNPGGMQVEGQDDAILSGTSTDKDSMAPPPEAPEPQALKDQALKDQAARDEAAHARAADGGDVPAPSGAVAATSPATPLSATPLSAVPLPAVPIPAVPMPAATQAVERTASPPAAQPVSLTPSTAPAAEPAAPVAAMPEQRPAPPPVRPAPPARPVAAGAAVVQLAAMNTEAAAMTEWQRLTHRMPELLNGKQPTVVRVEHGGRTYWRLRTGGFGDIAEATAFCSQVRAKGAGCSLARF